MAAAVVAIIATFLAPQANRAQEGRAVTRETIATLSVAELEKLEEQQK